MNKILASCTLLLAAALPAQGFPNWPPANAPTETWDLADSTGLILTTGFTTSVDVTDCAVHIRFPQAPGASTAAFPDGFYYFDIRNPADLSVSLSLLPAADRIFQSTRNTTTGGYLFTRLNGRPVTTVADTDILPLAPYASPTQVGAECQHKVVLWWLGTSYPADPNSVANLQLIGAGSNNVIRDFLFFRIVGQDRVSGRVYQELGGNCEPNAGELGIAGVTVRLADASLNLRIAVTDGNGFYEFTGVPAGSYTVELANVSGSTWCGSTSVPVTAAGCCPTVVNFGRTGAAQCAGRTPGFWRNNNGVRLIQQGGYWDELRALNLVGPTAGGGWGPFDPADGDVAGWRNWLQNANATNMAYMLSAHLAAMQLNVLSGGVSATCTVRVGTGTMTIAHLMFLANQSLALYPVTMHNDPSVAAARAEQEALKNALDAANNNLNWF